MMLSWLIVGELFTLFLLYACPQTIYRDKHKSSLVLATIITILFWPFCLGYVLRYIVTHKDD